MGARYAPLAVVGRGAEAQQADAHSHEPRPQQHPVRPIELRQHEAQCLAEYAKTTRYESKSGYCTRQYAFEHDQ